MEEETQNAIGSAVVGSPPPPARAFSCFRSSSSPSFSPSPSFAPPPPPPAAPSSVSWVLTCYRCPQYHNEELYANLYTMHSWAGIIVVTLFYANYLGGFFSFFAGVVPQAVSV